MIFLIHLLEYLGVRSGAAIAIVISGKQLLNGETSKLGGTPGPGPRAPA